MLRLIKYIRYIIVVSSIFSAALIYLLVLKTTPPGSLVMITLGQIYAFTAVGFLYLALLATPLYFVFPRLPYRPLYTKARRALGFSAFIFAMLHGIIEYYKLLGGNQGLSYLTSKYALAAELGMISLAILTLLAITSFNFAVKFFGTNWKVLHRFVYLAGILVVFHALLLGTDFADLHSVESLLSLLLVSFLLTLEALRLDALVTNKFIKFPKYLIFSILIGSLLLGLFCLYLSPGLAVHNH